MALLKMRSTIVITNTNMFRSRKFLTLIGYISGFTEIDEADKLNQSYNLPHNNRLNPYKVLYFSGFQII